MKKIYLFFVLLFIFGCGVNTPEGTVKGFFDAANKGDYEKAAKYYSKEFNQMSIFSTPKEILASIAPKGDIKEVKILKAEQKGETAVVKFKIFFKNGTEKENTSNLVKENGEWKMGL